MRSNYCKGNFLIRKFKNCSFDVKKQLFKSYLSCLYCSQLWCFYTKKRLNEVRVSYNNVYRNFMSFGRRLSISFEFLVNEIECFTVLRRKSMHRFLTRLLSCSNTIVLSFVSSPYFMYHSILNNMWVENTHLFH